MSTERLLLADDHKLMRAGLRSLIAGFDGFEVVGEATDGHQTLEMVQQSNPTMVLLDILMPGMNGLEVLHRIKQQWPSIRVVMLSMNSAEEYVLQAMRSGASGYIVKSDSPTEFELALRAVSRGDTYLSSTVSKHVISGYLNQQTSDSGILASPLSRLTPRQREVLQLIAEGFTTKEIATKLLVSVKTVETHRMQLMQQLDIHDIAGLVRFAISKGLIATDS